MDKFSYEANGYNRDEVNQFVNDVIKETEDIVKRVESQRDEIIYLKKELAHYKELERIGLAAPQVTYVMNELRNRGYDVDVEATTILEAKESILKAFQKK